MQLIQELINNKSSRICTRSPSGFVLEVTSDSSGHRVVAASPVDQNLCQYFVVTELPEQGSYTIANTAATGTFLEPTSTASAPLILIASSRRFADENQEWKLIFEENINGWLVHWGAFLLMKIITLSPSQGLLHNWKCSISRECVGFGQDERQTWYQRAVVPSSRLSALGACSSGWSPCQPFSWRQSRQWEQ